MITVPYKNLACFCQFPVQLLQFVLSQFLLFALKYYISFSWAKGYQIRTVNIPVDLIVPFYLCLEIMRIILEMKKLPHVLVALFLVIVPASQGKPLTSRKFLYNLFIVIYIKYCR
jgi:hypothetical protein